MPRFVRPWPYAAKANIQHEWDTDHLNIFVTFRHPMDIIFMPPLALWLCKVDAVLKAVTVSAWQDEWTLLLTVPNVIVQPERVTLEYDGPNENLRTTWDKTWEPWGAIISDGDIGKPYGSFKGNEINWQQAAAQDVWYTISDADISAGLENFIAFQNNQELKVAKAGAYLVSYYVSVECAIAGKHVLTSPEINGVEQPDGQTHHEFGRANEEESWGGTALFVLAINDVVSVGIAANDAGNPNLTVNHIGLTVVRVDE